MESNNKNLVINVNMFCRYYVILEMVVRSSVDL